jgi:hypothetical protein
MRHGFGNKHYIFVYGDWAEMFQIHLKRFGSIAGYDIFHYDKLENVT